jgi:hypothetical protein
MSTEETARKPGRPRRYGPGRRNATIRFTAERYAALKAEADKAGRSVSEQVETIVEQASTVSTAVATTVHELRANDYTLGSPVFGGKEEVVARINKLEETVARVETLLRRALGEEPK